MIFRLIVEGQSLKFLLEGNSDNRSVYWKKANKNGSRNGAAKAVKRPVNPMANPEKAPVSRFI